MRPVVKPAAQDPTGAPAGAPANYADFLEHFLDQGRFLVDPFGAAPTTYSLRVSAAVAVGAPGAPAVTDAVRQRLIHELVNWWTPGTYGVHKDHGYTRALGELIDKLGPYCAYCGVPCYSNLQVEHLLPKSLFLLLGWDWSNFLPSCGICNGIKGARPDIREALEWGYRPGTADVAGFPQPTAAIFGSGQLNVDLSALAVGATLVIIMQAPVAGADRPVLGLAYGGPDRRDRSWVALPPEVAGVDVVQSSFDPTTNVRSMRAVVPGSALPWPTGGRQVSFEQAQLPAAGELPQWLYHVNNLGWPDRYGAAIQAKATAEGADQPWPLTYRLEVMGPGDTPGERPTVLTLPPADWSDLAQLYERGAIFFDEAELMVRGATLNTAFPAYATAGHFDEGTVYVLRCLAAVAGGAVSGVGLTRVLEVEVNVNRPPPKRWSADRRVQLRTQAFIRALVAAAELQAALTAAGGDATNALFAAQSQFALLEVVATGFWGVWSAVWFQLPAAAGLPLPTLFTQAQLRGVFPGTVDVDFT